MSGNPEFVGSELWLVAPEELVKELGAKDLHDEANAINTIVLAAQRSEHPHSLSNFLARLRGDLYGPQYHHEKPYLRPLTEAGEAMATLEEGYIALRAAHTRRMHYLADQANTFLNEHQGGVLFQDSEGMWEPVTRVAVSAPDRWHHDPELYAQAGDTSLALLEGQLQCNRSALGPEIEARLASPDSEVAK